MTAGSLFLAWVLIASTSEAWAHQQALADKPGSDHQVIALPFPTYATPIDAAADLVGGFPESLEGNQALSIEAKKYAKNPEQLIMIITQDGVLDDSVSAQRYTVRLRPVADGWKLSSYKLETRCARGADVDEWKVGTCP